MPHTVGIIGLGIMGQPMARNLMQAGFQVVVDNRHQEVTARFVAVGAQSAPSPEEIAQRCNVVITMLPTRTSVEEVLVGPAGVIEGAHSELIVIDMSTSSPLLIRALYTRFAAKGVALLDAPVSGGEKGAADGTLSIMVGGDEDVFTACLPIFQALGTTITYAGSSGAGQIVKACNQIVVAAILEAVSEALVLGSKAGVDAGKILAALNGGYAASKVMEVRGPHMLDHDFTPGGRVRAHHKDTTIILELARAYNVALPVTALIDQMFAALEARGYGDLDHSALLTYIEDMSAHRIM